MELASTTHELLPRINALLGVFARSDMESWDGKRKDRGDRAKQTQ
jgi:hypothetical protein